MAFMHSIVQYEKIDTEKCGLHNIIIVYSCINQYIYFSLWISLHSSGPLIYVHEFY
jgi:hypothetical protein